MSWFLSYLAVGTLWVAAVLIKRGHQIPNAATLDTSERVGYVVGVAISLLLGVMFWPISMVMWRWDRKR